MNNTLTEYLNKLEELKKSVIGTRKFAIRRIYNKEINKYSHPSYGKNVWLGNSSIERSYRYKVETKIVTESDLSCIGYSIFDNLTDAGNQIKLIEKFFNDNPNRYVVGKVSFMKYKDKESV